MTLEKELKQAKDPFFSQPRTKSLMPSINKKSCNKKITRETFCNGFTFKVSESLFSVDRSNYSLHEYIVHN